MQVSFTGFKNASSLKVVDPRNGDTAIGINVQLTDDSYGKELSEFKDVLKKNENTKIYRNPINSSFLNVAALRSTEGNARQSILVLNGKPLNPSDETLGLYSFIAKLTRELVSTKPEKFVVNRDFLDSEDLRYGLIVGQDMKEFCGDKYDEVVSRIHNPAQVKIGAQVVNNAIQAEMVDYLA